MIARTVVLGAVALLVAAPVAQADLKPGSKHPLLSGDSPKRMRLAMPLPTVTKVPTLQKLKDGRVKATARVRYTAANWKGGRRVARDRTTVWLRVARRLRTTGPDPSKPRYQKAVVRKLGKPTSTQSYAFTLPANLSRALIARGALATKGSSRRSKARKLVWLDVQQDRDLQYVDGKYDWRAGTAWGAADKLPPKGSARAASSSQPSGTLTVQNGSGWGVATCGQSEGCNLAEGANYAPGTPGLSTAPMLVAADALQCVDSGTSGSNPVGLGNLNANGVPQVYAPGGAPTGAWIADDFIPASYAYAVTQPIVADDTIALASNNEVADTSGLVQGLLGLGWQAVTTWTGMPSSAAAGLILLGTDTAMPIPSPGAIVSAALDIAEFVIDNSCDGAPNLMNVTAVEPGGGMASNTIEIETQDFSPYPGACNGGYVDDDCPTGKWAFGLQLNPSTSTYAGQPLYLNQYMQGYGVADNVTHTTGTNYIGLNWYSQNPCTGVWGMDGYVNACAQTPAPSPTVQNATGSVNCGPSNLYCPAPAAGWPPPGSTTPGAGGVAYSCGTILPPGEVLLSGQSRTSPNGVYTLTMQANGVLTLVRDGSVGLWNSYTIPPIQPSELNGPGVPGSTAAVMTNGAFGVTVPDGGAQWQTTSSAYPGSYLAVQNDGNLVLYSPAAVPLWSSGTWSGTPCPPPVAESTSSS